MGWNKQEKILRPTVEPNEHATTLRRKPGASKPNSGPQHRMGPIKTYTLGIIIQYYGNSIECIIPENF